MHKIVKMSISVFVTSIWLSTAVLAETRTCNNGSVIVVADDCTQVIKACDKALADKDKALELKDLALSKCMEHGINVQYELNETKASLEAWYHNPLILIPLGLIGGIVADRLLFK